VIDRKNRGRNVETPDPEQIKSARVAAGLTQTQAGALVFTGCRGWQKWESGDNRMHPSIWRDWNTQIKAGK
jgi:DNA-binding transcriptional regulator YiaG